MSTAKSDIVLALLLHLGGVDQADLACKVRVADSIRPVDREESIWQARDGVLGASWIVVLDGREIMILVSDRLDGKQWLQYKPAASAKYQTQDDAFALGTVAAFHDTKHDVAPPALLKVGDTVIYRNISGNVVEIEERLAAEILELNNIR